MRFFILHNSFYSKSPQRLGLKLIKGYVKPLTYSPSLKQHIEKIAKQSDNVDLSLDLLKDRKNVLKPLSIDDHIQVFENIVKSKRSINLLIEDWHRMAENILNFDWLHSPIPMHVRRTMLYMLKEMKSNGVHPDAFIYASLLKAVSDDKNEIIITYKFIRKLQSEELTLKPVVNNKLIQILLQILQLKVPEYVLGEWYTVLWEDLKAFKIHPTMDTCLEFLKCPQSFKHHHQVLNIHSILKSRKNQLKETWDIQVYEILMRIHLKLKNYDAVRKLFFEIIQDHLSISR